MKTSWMWGTLTGAALVVGALPASAGAPITGEPVRSEDSVVMNPAAVPSPLRLETSSWGGPRVGFMFAPGDAEISKRLEENGLGNMVSQFGWQFERRVAAVAGGPQLVTEFVPLIGGVEYGKAVPSLNALLGVRFRNGFEFGMGPSLAYTGSATGGGSALLIAAGKSLEFGAVNIPLNVTLSTNKNGTMFSLMAGYSINRAAH
jgi:hypothetical protein